ncbi:MAG: DegT/DnrJ/EryC1/StrS family aminotransferase, partial [Bacteroidota bacterium]
PLPRLTYYRESIGLLESDFPNAMAHFAHEVSLPVYYDLQDAEVERVVSVVVDSVQRILSGL